MPENTGDTGSSPESRQPDKPPADNDGAVASSEPDYQQQQELGTDQRQQERPATNDLPVHTQEEVTQEEKAHQPAAVIRGGGGDSILQQNGDYKGMSPSAREQQESDTNNTRCPQLSLPNIKMMYNRNHLPTDIREDEYYYEWMEEILEAFPNKGPPYTPGRLSNNMYIGSLVNAEDENLLKRLGITHVLNCAGTRRFDLDKSPYPKEVGIKEYRMIPAEDFEDYDIVKHFGTAFEFLDRCKSKGGRCLVHCNLGVNRSGAVCAGYLMMSESKSLLQVTEQLKRVRSVVLTNRGFRYQLINYARMRNLLDPIIVENGLPATIAPPTGNSKFANGARREAKSRRQVGSSDVPPASDFLNINGVPSATCTYKSSTEIRPSSATGVREPPVSSRSFTRSSSAMGVHRKPYRWSDADVDEYLDDSSQAPYKYESKTSFFRPSRFSSSSSSSSSYSRPSTSLGFTETGRPSSSLGFSEGLSFTGSSRSSSKDDTSFGSTFSLFRHKPVYSQTVTPSVQTYKSSISFTPTASYDKPYNMLNLLSKTRGGCVTNGYNSSTVNSSPEPYHTLGSQGISYHVPKPPFGTSRRRFLPSKGFSIHY